MEPDKKYLTSSPGLIHNLVIDLTDKCNLRCVYCHQNIPGFKPSRVMSDSMIMHIMDYFKETKPPYAYLTGGGDITMAPEWHKKCEMMLNYGIPIRSTVNLAKPLSQEEAEAMAKFSWLTVSIDTVNPALLKQYRKAADIRTISQNILMIKSAALRLGIPQPELTISAVYYAEIAAGLEDVVFYAASVGARYFGLQDLLEYTNIENNVTPVWKLKGTEAENVVKSTRKALATADKLGLTSHLPGDFLKRLTQLEDTVYDAAA